MRIAQVSPLFESVPPNLYGGTERIVSFITEELVRGGHEVTLFASGDSVTKARLVSVCPTGLWRAGCEMHDAYHTMLLEHVMSLKDEFDVIHFHFDYWHLPIARRSGVPYVTTLHGRLDLPDLVPLYQTFRDTPVVSISDAQRQPLPWLNWQQTIHHGLPLEQTKFNEHAGDYLAFVGRASPEKGLTRAIQIARRAEIPLRIAAAVQPANREYFERVIRPQLDDPFIEFVGELGGREKDEFMADAKALLFPIDWPEPFGLVMIEAMASGTPVVAFRRGSVPEVIRDGVSGFVVENEEGAVRAVSKLDQIDRHAVRQYFMERFTAECMVAEYLDVYSRLIELRAEKSDGELSSTTSGIVQVDGKLRVEHHAAATARRRARRDALMRSAIHSRSHVASDAVIAPNGS